MSVKTFNYPTRSEHMKKAQSLLLVSAMFLSLTGCSVRQATAQPETSEVKSETNAEAKAETAGTETEDAVLTEQELSKWTKSIPMSSESPEHR